MVTLTNKQLADSIVQLNVLGQEKFPSKLAYLIGRNTRIVAAAYTSFERERNSLIEAYAKKDKDGKPTGPSPGRFTIEDQDGFQKAHDELLAETVDLDLRTITLDEIGSREIQPAVLAALDWMVLSTEKPESQLKLVKSEPAA